MNNKQAYAKLLNDRRVIVAVLERAAGKHSTAEQLAEKITNKDDPLELVELILQAAKHIKRTAK